MNSLLLVLALLSTPIVEDIELGQPIEVSADQPVSFTVINLTTGELHQSVRESTRDKQAVISIWADRPTKFMVVAVTVTDLKVVKTIHTLNVGGSSVSPPQPPDKFGYIKRTREAKQTLLSPATRSIFALTLANNYGTLSKQFKPDSSPAEDQIKALLAATVALNRKTIPSPVPADVKATLQALVEAINADDSITTFEDYLQVWSEISLGFQ